MSSHLARNLYHLMRRSARRTSVDKLRKTGHKTVSVLNFRDIEELIERSVENTLRRKGLRLDAPDIHDEVRLEFLALMRERDILRETVDSLLQEQDELNRNRELLQNELQSTAQELMQQQTAAPEEFQGAEELSDLAQQVATQLREVLGPSDPATAERAISMVTKAIDAQRETALERAREEQASKTDQLHRRMSKLKRKLAETEDMLERARAEGGGPEGISGEAVEAGLKLGDPNHGKKRELLGEIFRLNVELREMLEEKND